MVLFRRADPDALQRCIDGPGSTSALDHASHVTHDLAVVDRHLRTLLGEEHRAPAGPAEHAAHDTGQATVVDALTRTGDQLARTINGTTDADWQHATIGSHRVLDLLTLILHEADHGSTKPNVPCTQFRPFLSLGAQRGEKAVAARGPPAIARRG